MKNKEFCVKEWNAKRNYLLRPAVYLVSGEYSPLMSMQWFILKLHTKVKPNVSVRPVHWGFHIHTLGSKSLSPLSSPLSRSLACITDYNFYSGLFNIYSFQMQQTIGFFFLIRPHWSWNLEVDIVEINTKSPYLQDNAN